MTFVTITFRPNEDLLSKVSEAERIRWAEALESGEYVQGMESLAFWKHEEGKPHNEPTLCHCCLGVLAHIQGHELNPEDPQPLLGDGNTLDGVDMEDISAAVYDDDSGVSHLTAFYNLNDDHRLTFAEIAQLLRGNSVSVTYNAMLGQRVDTEETED